MSSLQHAVGAQERAAISVAAVRFRSVIRVWLSLSFHQIAWLQEHQVVGAPTGG